jgi:uncharacterized membrane protein YhaH (DUF805 family)
LLNQVKKAHTTGRLAMTLRQSVATCYRRYADFTGRASRSEYWWFVLFAGLVEMAGVVLAVLMARSSAAGVLVALFVLFGLFVLGTILPTFAVWVRRLHDTDHSGAWWFIGLIPVIGGIVLFVFLVSKGTPAPNRYGPPTNQARSG